jgi:thioredoxin 2
MTEPLHIVCPHCQATNRVPRARLSEGGTCGKCKHPLFTGRPIVLPAGAFPHFVARTELPVVVDFWASWCGPCKAFAPVFERAAAELEPWARLIKIDTEQEASLAAEHRIRSIPTLVILQGGRELARQAGAMDLQGFLRWVRSHVPTA